MIDAADGDEEGDDADGNDDPADHVEVAVGGVPAGGRGGGLGFGRKRRNVCEMIRTSRG